MGCQFTQGKISDPRTREAIGLCFDYEWTNKNLFYSAYTRSQSVFERSEFKAQGIPSKEELALLEPFRDSLPKAAFGEPTTQYVTTDLAATVMHYAKPCGF